MHVPNDVTAPPEVQNLKLVLSDSIWIAFWKVVVIGALQFMTK